MQNKTIVMNVDYFDEVCIREKPFGPSAVDALIQRCAKAGVNIIFWRAVGLGVAGYPSRLLQEPESLADSDMSSFMSRMAAEQQDKNVPSAAKAEKHFVLEVQQQSGYRQSIGRWGKRIAASLQQMDPLVEARDACRRHGIKFFIWHDFLDERHNPALAQHPEWQVLSRDGKSTFPGLRSYAIEEAVADQLRVIKELLAYHPDGLYFCTSCHNRHLHFPEMDDFFGFEEPVIAACHKERGVDIRTGPFDLQHWHEIKGNSITHFFRQVKQLAKPLGIKIAIGTQLGEHTILTAPVFSTHVPYRFATQWRKWVDEEIADILILGDYEWPWDLVPIWQAKQMSWPPGTYAADVEWKPYAEYIGERAQLYWFSSWLSAYAAHHQGASAGSLKEAMQMRAKTLATTPVDGICLHEAMTFEQDPDGFKMVADINGSDSFK